MPSLIYCESLNRGGRGKKGWRESDGLYRDSVEVETKATLQSSGRDI